MFEIVHLFAPVIWSSLNKDFSACFDKEYLGSVAGINRLVYIISKNALEIILEKTGR